jgi:hypothetical protein
LELKEPKIGESNGHLEGTTVHDAKDFSQIKSEITMKSMNHNIFELQAAGFTTSHACSAW